MTTVYIIDLDHPTRAIKTRKAEIKVGKWVWAITERGTRHLMGSSAFLTLPAARRARLGILVKLSKDSWLQRYYPHTFAYICGIIKKELTCVN